MSAAQTEQLSHAGWTLMWAGNAKGAIREFKAALAIDPEHINALTGLTQSHLNLGEIKDAETPANALLRVAPNNAVSHRLRAEILRRKRQSYSAINVARQAVALDPHEPLGYHILALCYSDHKDHKSAVKVCDEGLAAAPGAAILHAQRADNLLELHGGPKAQPSVEAALRLAPDSEYVQRVAARVALAQSQIERARDLLSAVLRRNANSREALGLYLMTEPNRHRVLRTLYIFRYWRREHPVLGPAAFIGVWSLFILAAITVVLITNIAGLFLGLGVQIFLRSRYAAHQKEVRAHFAQFALNPGF